VLLLIGLYLVDLCHVFKYWRKFEYFRISKINSPNNSPDEASPSGSASGVFGHYLRNLP